jgi:hypothetical protein
MGGFRMGCKAGTQETGCREIIQQKASLKFFLKEST